MRDATFVSSQRDFVRQQVVHKIRLSNLPNPLKDPVKLPREGIGRADLKNIKTVH